MIFLQLDPNTVKPGWTPLIILIGLVLVMVLLYFSMRRQFRKISVPERAGQVAPGQDASRRPERTAEMPPAEGATPAGKVD